MIQVVFQNKDVVVCNKPAMVLSVPAREKTDKRNCLGLELQRFLKQQVFPVHRLDFEVSGLIVYALTAKAHRDCQNWFIQRKIKKMYCAITEYQDFSHWPENIKTERGAVPPEISQVFVWKTKMMRGKKRSYESDRGEWAETRAQIVGEENSTLRWQLYPVTGKPHQLRFELSRRGFPIIGDALYGSKAPNSEAGIVLKAYELDLTDLSAKDRFGLPEKLSI